MQHRPITRSQSIRRAVLYTLMTITVLVTATILVLFIQGYRLDRKEGVERVGLVQLGSQPTGAKVYINNEPLSRRTNVKTTLLAGSYSLEMRRDGYHTWEKTIPVKAGSVVWVRYPRLIPEDLKTKTAVKLPDLVDSKVSSDNKQLAATTATGKLTFYALSTTAKKSGSSINLAKKTTSPAATTDYTIKEWSADSKYILVQQKDAKKMQWLVVNRKSGSVENINEKYNIDPSDVQFQPSNSRYTYVRESGNLRRIDHRKSSLSQVDITNVGTFSLRKSTAIYTTNPDGKDAEHEVGLMRPGKTPITLGAAMLEEGDFLGAASGEYYGKDYVATVRGKELLVYRGDLGAVKNDAFEDSFKLEYKTTLESEPKSVEMRNSSRFVVVNHKDGLSVYDVEMGRLTHTDSAPADGWLDGYLSYANQNKTLTLQEFDGGNPRKIGPATPNQAALLNARGDTLFWVAPDASGDTVLMRASLRI